MNCNANANFSVPNKPSLCVECRPHIIINLKYVLLVKVCSGQRDDISRPCIFPWIDYKTNLTHQGCANPDKDEGGLWCATQLDKDGYWLDYGYCKYCE